MGIGDWGLGIGDWGLGIGDWAQSPIPNPQSPIPNPHILQYKYFNKTCKILKLFNLFKSFLQILILYYCNALAFLIGKKSVFSSLKEFNTWKSKEFKSCASVIRTLLKYTK